MIAKPTDNDNYLSLSFATLNISVQCKIAPNRINKHFIPPPPPTVITRICEVRPLQRIRKPSSKFRRKRPVILQRYLIPKLATSKAKLKHQRFSIISHLRPKKQIQLPRKSHPKQQENSNTIRKEKETDTLCDITDKRPISSILCMSYIICI